MTREEFISMMGYRDDSPLRNEDSLNIQTGPNGIIDMSNTGIPLIANNRYLPPYSGYHQFEPNSVVTEIPLEKYKSDPRVPKRVGARNNPDGSESTHLMRTETIDGINWVSFPTLFQNPDGSWLDMSDEENWRIPMMEAKKRGELIHFGQDKEAALRFGEGSWKPEEEHFLMREHGGALPKAQSNIETEILNANIEADKWNKEYVQSDNYMSMLKRAGEKDKVINSRIAQAMNFDPYTHITYDINNPSLGQYYNTGYSTSSGETYPPGLMYHPSFGENMLNYNPTLMENHPAYFNPGIATSGWEGLAGHELIGHYGVDKLNRKQRKALKSLINWDALSSFAGDSDEAYDHGKDVYEMRANLGQLRYQLDKAGIYDSKKGLAVTEDGEEGDNPFTEEHLKQILEFNEDGTFKRIKPEFNNEILQFVAPQDLIWMMNNIAMDQEIGDDLPKGTMRAQDGTELTMDKYGKIDTEGMDYNTSDLYNFIKDKYTKVPTGGIQKNLLNKLQSETFRDRYAKNYFNITGEHLSEEELTNRIGQQYDFTAAGAPFHITFPYVSHTPKGYRRVHTPYISPFHTSKEAGFRNAKGMYSKNPFWGDNTPDWKIKNEEGDWVYPTIDDINMPEFSEYSFVPHLFDHRDSQIMSDDDVIRYDDWYDIGVHEYAHSYNTEDSPLFKPAGTDFRLVDRSTNWQEMPGDRYKTWLTDLFGEDYWDTDKNPWGTWAMKPWEISSVRAENERKMQQSGIWDHTKEMFSGDKHLKKMLNKGFNLAGGASDYHLELMGFNNLRDLNYKMNRIKKDQREVIDDFDWYLKKDRKGTSTDYISNNIIHANAELDKMKSNPYYADDTYLINKREKDLVMNMDEFNELFNSSQSDLDEKHRYDDYNSLIEHINLKDNLFNKKKRERANKVLNSLYDKVREKLETSPELDELKNQFDEQKGKVVPKLEKYFNEIAQNKKIGDDIGNPMSAKYGKELPKFQKKGEFNWDVVTERSIYPDGEWNWYNPADTWRWLTNESETIPIPPPVEESEESAKSKSYIPLSWDEYKIEKPKGTIEQYRRYIRNPKYNDWRMHSFNPNTNITSKGWANKEYYRGLDEESIGEVQEWLIENGYDVKKDSSWGDETYNALNNYLLDSKLLNKEYTTHPLLTDDLLINQQYIESDGKPKAGSHKGALGLVQAMPGAWNDAIRKGILPENADRTNINHSLLFQRYYMNSLMNAEFVTDAKSDNEKLARALAAYNWGRGNTPRFFKNINYVATNETIKDKDGKVIESGFRNKLDKDGNPILVPKSERRDPNDMKSWMTILDRSKDSTRWTIPQETVDYINLIMFPDQYIKDHGKKAYESRIKSVQKFADYKEEAKKFYSYKLGGGVNRTKQLIKTYKLGGELSGLALKHLEEIGIIPKYKKGGTTHDVNDEDTLLSIATKYNTTEKDINRYNNLIDTEPLYKGQVLDIPEVKVETPLEIKKEKHKLGDYGRFKNMSLETQIKLYSNYVNGDYMMFSEKLGKKLYDKLNRVYYDKARVLNMSVLDYMKSILS